jgi:hypothetical protein
MGGRHAPNKRFQRTGIALLGPPLNRGVTGNKGVGSLFSADQEQLRLPTPFTLAKIFSRKVESAL